METQGHKAKGPVPALDGSQLQFETILKGVVLFIFEIFVIAGPLIQKNDWKCEK